MHIRMSRRALTTSLLGSALAAVPLTIRAQEATPVASPGSASNRVQAALDELPALVRDHMERTGVPGMAVGVVTPDGTVFAEGFGVRHIGDGGEVDAETIFQVASVSKPIASTVVAALVGEGVVGWDTKIAEIYPDFALSDPWVTANVTIADLFSHRSGLPDHAGDVLEDLGASRGEVVHQLRYLELEGAFRDSYAYTNFGLTAAAVAAAHAAGTTWEDVANERLFGPLGMTRSSFRFGDIVDDENRAHLHILRDSGWSQEYERQADAQAPAGGASASIADLCRWMQLQMSYGTIDGEEMIDPAALGMTHLAHSMRNLPEPPYNLEPPFYGLGWNVDYDAMGNAQLAHSGAFALGAATAVYLRPADGIGIAVVTNGQPIGIPESLCISFLDLVSTGEIQADYLSLIRPVIEEDVLPEYGAEVADPPETAEPAAPLDTYTGTYTNDFFGDLQVTHVDDGLMMVLGPAGMQFSLEHYSRDVFTYQPTGENAGGPSAVTFSLNGSGTASHVVIENLDVYGAGTFRRNDNPAG